MRYRILDMCRLAPVLVQTELARDVRDVWPWVQTSVDKSSKWMDVADVDRRCRRVYQSAKLVDVTTPLWRGWPERGQLV